MSIFTGRMRRAPTRIAARPCSWSAYRPIERSCSPFKCTALRVVSARGYPHGRRQAGRTLIRSPLKCTASRVVLMPGYPYGRRQASRTLTRSPLKCAASRVVLRLGYPHGRRWASRTLIRSPLKCTAFRVALCLRCPHRRAGRLRLRSRQRDYSFGRFGPNRLHEVVLEAIVRSDHPRRAHLRNAQHIESICARDIQIATRASVRSCILVAIGMPSTSTPVDDWRSVPARAPRPIAHRRSPFKSTVLRVASGGRCPHPRRVQSGERSSGGKPVRKCARTDSHPCADERRVHAAYRRKTRR